MVLLFTNVLSKLKEKIKEKKEILVIISVAMVSLFPLYYPGFIYTHDGIIHLFRTQGTYQNIMNFDMFNRIYYNMINGQGYGWGIFYPPLSSIIPALFILTYNLSIRLGLQKISGYFQMRIGYKCVMLGLSLLFISIFLINTGYAKDSAFRHNAPVMKKDIIWICIAIAISLIVAMIIKIDKNTDIFYKDIQQYKELGYMLKS